MSAFSAFVSGGTYQSPTVSADQSRLINWFPELIESGEGKSRVALRRTPGFQRAADLTAYGPVRGQLVVQGALPSLDRVFCLAGGHLLELNSAFAVTDRGSMATALLDAPIASSGEELVCTQSGSDVRAFDLGTNTLSSSVANVTANFLVFMDGYFIAANGSSRQFQISSLFDGQTWDPLDFATAEATPGLITGLLVQNDTLWIFKSDCIQLYQNTGNADFPFEPVPGGVLPYGVLLGSIQQSSAGIAVAGRDARGGIVTLLIQGQSVKRISTHAIEEQLGRVEPSTYAFTWSYIHKGHEFYGVTTLPESGGPTETAFVYDLATGLWHERAHWAGQSLTFVPFSHYTVDGFVPYFLAHHVYAFGKHLIANYYTSALYELTDTVYVDQVAIDYLGVNPAYYINPDGLIKRIRRAPYIYSEKKNVIIDEFEVEMDAGTGTGLSGAEPEPVLNLRWSNDNGRTWTPDTPRRIGAAGDYRQRIRWNRLGKSRGRIIEVNTVAKCEVAITNAYMRARECVN